MEQVIFNDPWQSFFAARGLRCLHDFFAYADGPIINRNTKRNVTVMTLPDGDRTRTFYMKRFYDPHVKDMLFTLGNFGKLCSQAELEWHNAKTLLDKVVRGEEKFHVIEVMACPGGCIGGGGQPYPPQDVKVLDPELLRLRAQALYAIDQGKQLRTSLDNPAVKEVYASFLEKPGSEKAHRLLHTAYQPKLPRGIR